MYNTNRIITHGENHQKIISDKKVAVSFGHGLATPTVAVSAFDWLPKRGVVSSRSSSAISCDTSG